MAIFVEEGSVSTERVSVKGRNALNELSVILLDTATRVRELAPPTAADEEKHGFSKYHLGAVLVRDGFQEYERLNLCKDILARMKVTCLNAIDDDKMLAAIKKYDEEVNRFVALMQDLGLYRIMIKNREFEYEKKETEKNGATEEESPPNDTTETCEAETYEAEIDKAETDKGETEPTPPAPEADDKQKESIAESLPKSPSKRKSRRYSVTGKWNSFPEAASPSVRKSKISQDLASPAFKKGSKTSGKAKERAPEEVFVTPARKSKKLPGLSFDGDGSSTFPGNLNLQDDDTTARSTTGSPTKMGRPPKPSKPSDDREFARLSDTNRSLAATGDAPNEDIGAWSNESIVNVTEEAEGGLNSADRENSSKSELNDTSNSVIDAASSVIMEGGNSQTDVTTTTTVVNTTEVSSSVERETRTDIMTGSFRSLNESGTVLWSKDQDADYVETEFGQSGAHWLDSMAPRMKEKPQVDGQKTKWGPGVVRRMTSFRFLTFCGIDDSIDPKLLGIISKCYPLVEFAVLLRPDMSGQPRYASIEWLQQLVAVQKKSDGEMKLAAHLCGSLVNEILKGDDTMLFRLAEMQFQRIQINATAINGVNTHQHGKYVESFLEAVTKHPNLEITLQKNKETKPLWEGILKRGNIPSNFSMLFDESKGKGIIAKSFQSASTEVKVGYAGGIGIGGRYMTKKVIKEIIKAGNGQQVWMSMETGVRSTRNGKDVFDIDACYQIIDIASEMDIQLHPNFVA